MSDRIFKPIESNRNAADGCDNSLNSLVLSPRLGEEEIEHLAVLFKATAHPVRLRILDLIDQGEGEVCSCEIERFFDLSQPTISHHLKILQEAGLITSEPRGVWVYHKIRQEAFDILRAHLTNYQTTR
jgi:ArsR family transcriptional regulator, arsenate/arsenite/antimonite-responsive transcriptional repressor